MGLDARDCRLDIGFLLGTDDVPDNVYWSEALRDKSCVWLDFVDAYFSQCKSTDADVSEIRSVTACVVEKSAGASTCDSVYQFETCVPTTSTSATPCRPEIEECVKANTTSSIDSCITNEVCLPDQTAQATPIRKNVVACVPRTRTVASTRENTTVEGRVGVSRRRA